MRDAVMAAVHPEAQFINPKVFADKVAAADKVVSL
jgi:hypothetical protein